MTETENHFTHSDSTLETFVPTGINRIMIDIRTGHTSLTEAQTEALALLNDTTRYTNVDDVIAWVDQIINLDINLIQKGETRMNHDQLTCLGAGLTSDLNYGSMQDVLNSENRPEISLEVPADQLSILSLGIIDQLLYGGEELLS